MQKTKCCMVAVLLGATALAYGQETQPQPGYGFTPTVKELLQADARKARAAALGEAKNTAAHLEKPATEAKPQLVVELVGMYGHNGMWKADVAIAGHLYTFSAGDSYAGFKARRISSRCIELQHARFPQKLCRQS